MRIYILIVPTLAAFATAKIPLCVATAQNAIASCNIGISAADLPACSATGAGAAQECQCSIATFKSQCYVSNCPATDVNDAITSGNPLLASALATCGGGSGGSTPATTTAIATGVASSAGGSNSASGTGVLASTPIQTAASTSSKNAANPRVTHFAGGCVAVAVGVLGMVM